MSNFIYEYIRIFIRVEIFTNVTLWAGESGEFCASEKYDDSGDSFKLGVLVIPRSLLILMILANLMDLVILVILMNQVILVMTVILLNLTGKNANSKFVEGEMKSSIHF